MCVVFVYAEVIGEMREGAWCAREKEDPLDKPNPCYAKFLSSFTFSRQILFKQRKPTYSSESILPNEKPPRKDEKMKS